jgi:hypothetical protein
MPRRPRRRSSTALCVDAVWPSIQIAVAHPQRVLGIVAIAPGVPLLTPGLPFRVAAMQTFEDGIDDRGEYEGSRLPQYETASVPAQSAVPESSRPLDKVTANPELGRHPSHPSWRHGFAT